MHSQNQGVEVDEPLRNSHLACLFSFCRWWSPRAMELSSSTFMLCWALGPQSGPGVDKCLCSQVSKPKDGHQAGGKARERLTFQPQSGLGPVLPHAPGHYPSSAHSISQLLTKEPLCRSPRAQFLSSL